MTEREWEKAEVLKRGKSKASFKVCEEEKTRVKIQEERISSEITVEFVTRIFVFARRSRFTLRKVSGKNDGALKAMDNNSNRSKWREQKK